MTSTWTEPRWARHGCVLAAAVLLGVLLAGCGLSDPAAGYYTTSTAASQTAVDPTPAPERGGTINQSASPTRAPGPVSVSPVAALRQYANLACNWTAANVAAHQRQLVSDSLGQARANAQQALTELSADHSLAANSIVNRCQIVSVTRGVGPAKGEWVLVLKQSTVGSGDYSSLPATFHVIYANATRLDGGYVASKWSALN